MSDRTQASGVLDLPHNYEAEQAWLGAILFDNGIFRRWGDIVRPEDFFDAAHGRIYETAGRLIGRGERADVLTLKRQFDQDDSLAEIGGAKYLASLANAVVTLVGAQDYARAIRDLADRRTVIRLAEDAIAAARDGDLDQSGSDMAASFSRDLGMIVGSTADLSQIRDVTKEIEADLDRPVDCAPTGLASLDHTMRGGLYPTFLYGIVARKKSGKTNLLTTIAHNVAAGGTPVLYLWLEMNKKQISQRILARVGGFNSLRFLDRDAATSVLFAEKLQAAKRIVWEMPIFFQDRARSSIDDVESTITRAVLGKGIRGVFIDYLQLIGGQQKGMSESQHLDRVSRRLAHLCQSLGIWIVVAAQENQTGNVRGGESIRQDCAQCYRLNRLDAIEPAQVWLEMLDSRYTPLDDVGSAIKPAMELITRAGPHFADIPRDDPQPSGDIFEEGRA